MTRKHIFLKRVLPVLVVFVISLLLSFFYLYYGIWESWNDLIYGNWTMWWVVVDTGYHFFSPLQTLIAYIHLFTILFSLYFIIIRSYEVINFVAFPSIKAAKKYMKEKRRLKKLEKQYINKQKIEDAKIVYLKKMQQLEEEKKKYL